jgi:ABC-type oligopeptide transport system substrate-binding subunit
MFQVRERYLTFDWDAFRAAWEKEAQPAISQTAFTTIQLAHIQAVTMDKMIERIQKEQQKEIK